MASKIHHHNNQYWMASSSMEHAVNTTADEEIGPTISNNVTKVLEECVQALVAELPPSTAKKNKGRVKRPMNAFMVYSQTARKAMAKVYPNLSYRTLSKALGKNWGVMGLDEKQPFIREAERLRLKHKEEYPDYKFKPSKNRGIQHKGANNFAKKCRNGASSNNSMSKTDDCGKMLPGYGGKMTNQRRPETNLLASNSSNIYEQQMAEQRARESGLGGLPSRGYERGYFGERNFESLSNARAANNDFRCTRESELAFEKELVSLQQTPYNGFSNEVDNGSHDIFQRAEATTSPITQRNSPHYFAYSSQPNDNSAVTGLKDPALVHRAYLEVGSPCTLADSSYHGNAVATPENMDSFALAPSTYAPAEQHGCLYQNDFTNFCDFMTV